MPIADVSAAVAAKYEEEFYFDAKSPQGRTLRRLDCGEECDPDGYPTERALAYKREFVKYSHAELLPMLKDELRESFKIKRVNKKVVPWQGCPPEKVHFGLGVTIDQVDDYAHKHSLHDPNRDDTIFNVKVVVKHLAELTDCPNLYWKVIFSLDHDIVLAMYSNYTQKRLEMVPQDEKEVLEIIRTEIGLEPEQQPMWYICITSDWSSPHLYSYFYISSGWLRSSSSQLMDIHTL